MISRNPFIFGKVVTGKYFTNRTKELKELKHDIKNHINVILYGPRRYGKSSLIFHLFESLRKENRDFIGIYIDFYRIYSKEKFIKIFAESASKALGWNVSKILEFFKGILKTVVPRVTVDNEGKPVVDFNPQFNWAPSAESDRLLEDVMQIPIKLADTGKTVCIAFDEFQEIKKLNGNELLKELRSFIQLQKEVSYIFSGSKTHLMKDLFANKLNPFYNIGKIKYIDKIDTFELVEFLSKGFRDASKDITLDMAKEICNISDSVPYYTQMLAYEIFNISGIEKEITKDTVNQAVELILTSKSEEYIFIWENLSLTQKKALEIVIKNDGKSIYNSNTLSKFHIASSSLNKAIDELKNKTIIDSERQLLIFTDIFFKEWLIKRIL